MMKGSAEVTSPLFTEKEAAHYLTRSVSSLRRGRRSGTGPKFVRIGRSVRYQKSQLDAYIDARVAMRAGEVRRD
jgi:predicted DNA-binding transcriptional regulator AlpA